MERIPRKIKKRLRKIGIED
jgi:hypothetical protein